MFLLVVSLGVQVPLLLVRKALVRLCALLLDKASQSDHQHQSISKQTLLLLLLLLLLVLLAQAAKWEQQEEEEEEEALSVAR
mmetsp:Transcript_18700/g.35811  ORF Transcript_18700/g.35811 Transcript_18700/m.35811 type:complete len:82 (-) Transcript_18700:50-295(-)